MRFQLKSASRLFCPRHSGSQKLAESCAGFLIQRRGHHTLLVQGHSSKFHFNGKVRNGLLETSQLQIFPTEPWGTRCKGLRNESDLWCTTIVNPAEKKKNENDSHNVLIRRRSLRPTLSASESLGFIRATPPQRLAQFRQPNVNTLIQVDASFS